MLGQQELEGQRVPMMATGKTLPCFFPYDPNPRSGGFVGDRFLSGLRPPEFFFHCMAGREGLIDTAVKTSRSGYLQRCLMKHMESLKIGYDYTVRDADQSIIQFYYGEDAIDPVKMKYLDKYNFLASNFVGFSYKYSPYTLGDITNNFDIKSVNQFIKQREKNAELKSKDTLMNNFMPGRFLGAVSEKIYKSITDYTKEEQKKQDNIYTQSEGEITKGKFRLLSNVKYLHSLIQPGECVGCLAAMAIGEPSTQMTLNTFHLAGHGGVNLTLGIPRLREILMTASDKILTPIMSLDIREENLTKDRAENLARRLKKVNVLQLVKQISVKEYKRLLNEEGEILPSQLRLKIYEIDIQLENIKAISYAFGFGFSSIKKRLEKIFLPSLLQYIEKEKKRELKQDLKARISK